MKLVVVVLIILGLLTLFAIIAINVRLASYSTNKIYGSVESVPDKYPIAIVLGARVDDNGTPSNTIYDRVLTGSELYKAGKTRKLLLSGGNTEPAVMKKLALEFGVAETDIVLDDLGLRTFDSCSRAKRIFEINKAIVVTQDYHLPRSLYLCQSMGVDAIGVDAKRRDYEGEKFLWLREYFSRVLAWYDVNFRAAPPEPSEKRPVSN